jgi:cytochrome c oxidase subunit 2
MSLINLVSYCDAAEHWQLGMQDPATPMLEGMLRFNNFITELYILIGIFVGYILIILIAKYKYNYSESEKFTHSSLLEIVWTLIPATTLIIIAIPSFSLLYSLDELISPSLTLKIVGHQWYWSYEYSDYVELEGGDSLNFDSYMVNSDDLTFGAFRLLEVDNRVILPINTHIRLLVTAADVIHSWTIPSFGVKVDGCPGRLSQAALFIKREGVYYGQCSEICGINHGFMPIVVKGVSSDIFTNWIYVKLDNLV